MRARQAELGRTAAAEAANGRARASESRLRVCRPKRPTSHRPRRLRATARGVRRANARGSDEPPPVASDEPPPEASDEPSPVASGEPPPVASDEHRRRRPTSHRPWRPTSHRPWRPMSHRPWRPMSHRPWRPTSHRRGVRRATAAPPALNPRPPHQWTPRWRPSLPRPRPPRGGSNGRVALVRGGGDGGAPGGALRG